LNGKAFAGLNNLKHVGLGGNQCVDEEFDDESEIATITQNIPSTCSFFELEISVESINEMSEQINEKSEKLLKIAMENDEIKSLKNEIAAWKEENSKQMDLIRETYEQLDDERNKTAAFEMGELRNQIKSLETEIESLKTEIKEKDVRIHGLQLINSIFDMESRKNDEN
jgi:chromosome segregation ATPase